MVTMPRSGASIFIYAVAAVLVAWSLYGVIWTVQNSDHSGHIFEALDRELPALALAAFVFGVGVGVQYLSDIRWLLMKRDGD
jgi:hypothetical protein